MSALLGPASRLSVRWPEGAGDGSSANQEVEELYWMHIRPGSLVIDARLKFRVLEGRMRQVRLLADPRLRLLPTAGNESLIAEIHTLPGEPQVIDVELARPISDQATLDLSFLLTGTSGVGNLRLPRLEVNGARATRRWMAVSVDPALQFEEQPTIESKPLAVPEFAAAWGPGDARPNLAFSAPRGDVPLVIATRPREARSSVEQVLSLGVGQGQIAVRYDATLQTAAGYNFQLSLDGPVDLQVDNVSLLEEGVQRVTRFSRDPGGRITVFLNGPVSGTQTLALQGTIAAVESGQMTLPRLSVVGADAKKSQVNIYRSPAMLVDVAQEREMAAEGKEAGDAARRMLIRPTLPGAN